MNFLDLYKKIQQLDEGLSQGNIMPQAISAPPSAPVTECGAMEGCGDMSMMGHQEAPKQQDSVSMNVSMNASGVGGIRDLMNVLQNLEKTVGSDDKDMMIGKVSDEPIDVDISAAEEMTPPVMPEPPAMPEPTAMSSTPAAEEPMSDDEMISDEMDDEIDYANDPEIRKMSVAAVIGNGDDIHSKGKEAPKQAGGGNPWNVSESKIAANLSKHYAELKSRTNEAYGRRPPLNPDKFGDANKIQGSWAKGDKYDSSGNYLGGGGDEYIGDPYGKKERERIADKDKGPWYINAGGKTLKVGGQPKVFDHIKPARAYIKAIKAKNPKFGDSIITRQPEEMSPLEFMKRHLNVKGFSSVNEPGSLSKYYRPGIYNHFYGPEGTEKLNLALKYFTALIADPSTDPETQQKAAADVEALKKELAYRAEQGTFN